MSSRRRSRSRSSASFAPGARRPSSSSPARRSAIIRSRGALPSAAVASPSVGRRRAAFLRQQVDGKRRVAVGGEARRDRADVRGQSAVLVDDEHRTERRVGLRDDADQLAVGTTETDLLPGRRRGGCRRVGISVPGAPPAVDGGGVLADSVAAHCRAAQFGWRCAGGPCRSRRWRPSRRRRRHRPRAGSPRPTVNPISLRRRSASRGEQSRLAVEGDLLHDVVTQRHHRTLGHTRGWSGCGTVAGSAAGHCRLSCHVTPWRSPTQPKRVLNP